MNLTKSLSLIIALSIISTLTKAANYDAVVAKDGSGKYKSIQDAINAAPDGRTTPYKIFIKSGTYIGQITIPASKTFIELIGEDVAATTIAYGDGRAGTPAVIVNADDCLMMNLTLENTQGRIADGPQSLAIRTNSDRLVFFNCRFVSGQDTVLTNKAGSRNYFKDCYIDGNTDFIYGAAIAVFDNCVIYCRDRIDALKSSYLTAASTPADQTYGQVYRDCIIPSNHGVTGYTFGRPWQNDQRALPPGRKPVENKVVFLNTKIGNAILPVGWSVWNEKTLTNLITNAEYKSRKFDGSAVDVSKRISWSKQLTDTEAKPYYNNAVVFGNWDPFVVWTDLPKKSSPTSIALGNFRARPGDGSAILEFNSSWPQKGVTYTLYQGADKASLKKVDQLIAKTDTIIAYQFKTALPATDKSQFYLIKASKGKALVISDTLEVNATNMMRAKRGS